MVTLITERITLCNRTGKQGSTAKALPTHHTVFQMRQAQGNLHIIDVAADKESFQLFLTKWKSQSCYSLCLACYRGVPWPLELGGLKYPNTDTPL